MKLIHTADLHLGSKLDSVFSRELAKRRKNELISSFERMIAYAEANGVSDRIDFLKCDLMSEVVLGEYFALLSNPPYVADKIYEGLEGEIFHEPKMAFVGGDDGGDFYRRLTPIYRDKIANDGFIAYEIGYDQAEMLRQIAEECSMTCEILKDLGGNDRVAVLRK